MQLTYRQRWLLKRLRDGRDMFVNERREAQGLLDQLISAHFERA